MGYEITGPAEVAEKIFTGIEAFISGFRTGQQQSSTTRQPPPTPKTISNILPPTILGIETNKFLLYAAGTFVVLFALKLITRSSGRSRRR